jgi:hypothetical protein
MTSVARFRHVRGPNFCTLPMVTGERYPARFGPN